MAEIKLDDTQINAALQAAILTALGDVGREAIIKHAIAYLVKPGDSYRSQPSPLFEIVQNVGKEIARTVLTERMANDEEFQKQIHSLYEDAVKKLFSVETREKLVERLANKMADGLEKDRY